MNQIAFWNVFVWYNNCINIFCCSPLVSILTVDRRTNNLEGSWNQVKSSRLSLVISVGRAPVDIIILMNARVLCKMSCKSLPVLDESVWISFRVASLNIGNEYLGAASTLANCRLKSSPTVVKQWFTTLGSISSRPTFLLNFHSWELLAGSCAFTTLDHSSSVFDFPFGWICQLYLPIVQGNFIVPDNLFNTLQPCFVVRRRYDKFRCQRGQMWDDVFAELLKVFPSKCRMFVATPFKVKNRSDAIGEHLLVRCCWIVQLLFNRILHVGVSVLLGEIRMALHQFRILAPRNSKSIMEKLWCFKKIDFCCWEIHAFQIWCWKNFLFFLPCNHTNYAGNEVVLFSLVGKKFKFLVFQFFLICPIFSKSSQPKSLIFTLNNCY